MVAAEEFGDRGPTDRVGGGFEQEGDPGRVALQAVDRPAPFWVGVRPVGGIREQSGSAVAGGREGGEVKERAGLVRPGRQSDGRPDQAGPSAVGEGRGGRDRPGDLPVPAGEVEEGEHVVAVAGLGRQARPEAEPVARRGLTGGEGADLGHRDVAPVAFEAEPRRQLEEEDGEPRPSRPRAEQRSPGGEVEEPGRPPRGPARSRRSRTTATRRAGRQRPDARQVGRRLPFQRQFRRRVAGVLDQPEESPRHPARGRLQLR